MQKSRRSTLHTALTLTLSLPLPGGGGAIAGAATVMAMATESASAQNNARFHYHHLESFFTSASQTQAVAINNDHVIVGFTVEGGFTLHRAFA